MMFNLGNVLHHTRMKALFSSEPFTVRPPAIVVGDSVNALGVVRSLGKEGIRVLWVTSNPYSFVLASRFVDQVIVCSDIYYENFVPALKEIGALCLIRPVLFLTHDFQVKQVAAHQKTLLDMFQFEFPTSDMVEKLLSKTHFFQLAQENSLEVPGTYIIGQYGELEEFISSCSDAESYVVKPFEKSDDFEKHFGKALRITEKKHWQRFLETFKGIDCQILIQNWIPGGDHHIMFCLVIFNEHSECVLSFCGRKLKQYKPEIGSTASAEKMDSTEMRNATIQFFQRIKFTGMGSLEFKFCEKNKRLYAIEPTVGRTNLQSEVATVNGCNLVAVYYWELAGKWQEQQVCIQKAVSSQTRRVWMRLGADIKSSWFHLQHKHITLGEWLKSYFRPISFAVFRLDDPLPFLKLLGKNCENLTKRMVKSMKLLKGN